MITREQYVRVKQAADELGVSANTVRTWGAKGKIREYRHPVNNYRLYKRADLEAIMSSLRKPAARQAFGAKRKRAK